MIMKKGLHASQTKITIYDKANLELQLFVSNIHHITTSLVCVLHIVVEFV